MSAKSRKTYTVKQVAELSGVSIRTLHHYDQIGLLKPAFTGENGYRYYENEQLLTLKQILFYRGLDMKLDTIQQIVASPHFDRAAALRIHRERLVQENQRTDALIQTIDQTLAHLEREPSMKEHELFEYEKQAIDRWGIEKVEISRERTKGWTQTEYDQVNREYAEIHTALSLQILLGSPVESNDVQALIKKHYAVVSRFWTPDRNSYPALGRMYCDSPDFRKVYDVYHPGLAEYLAKAMERFAECELA